MSDAAVTDGPDTAPPPAAPAKSGLARLIKPLILVLGVALLLGAGFWFGGGWLAARLPAWVPFIGGHANGLTSGTGGAGRDAAAANEPPRFVDMPEIVANLNGNPHHSTYVKLQAKLQVGSAADGAALQPWMPRLQDLLQTYLRELRPEELRGSGGIYRLREELLSRIAVAVPGVPVQDIVFSEIIVQ